MRGRALLLALFAVAGCKKTNKADASAAEVSVAIAQLSVYADRLCACDDKACSDKVQEEMIAWSGATGKALGTARPSSAEAMKLSEISTRMTACYAKLNAVPALPASPEEPAPPAAPPGPSLPEKLTPPVAADGVLSAARAWAAKEHPDLHLARTVFSYVDAEGVLDATDGTFTLELGNPIRADNPARRTGAPVRDPAKATICAYLRFDGEWHSDSRGCRDTAVAPPHCTIAVMWKRALDKGAPRDAVAVIEYEPARAPTPWRFSITDAPRNVSFVQRFADDCETVIEQPPK